MLSHKFLFLFFGCILVFNFHAIAVEKKETPKEGEKLEEKTYSGAQSDEWNKAQKDLQTAKIKVDNDRDALEALKAAAEKDEYISKDTLAKINEAKETLRKSEANYQRFLNQYNMRFPEKGLDVGRKYNRPDSERSGVETVEEKPQGVEAKLRQLHRNIKKQYQTSSGTASSTVSVSGKKKIEKKQTNFDAPADGVTEKIKIEK
jgi:hypothetical protein